MAEQHNHQQDYKRFTSSQRFEHIIVILTFSVLALTGIPQKYASHDWAKSIIEFLGGIESVRIVHRIMATLLLTECIYHGGILSYKIYVLGQRLTMVPGIKDVKDVWDFVRYNLGWGKEHPHMPRYNFGEKIEYLAMVWGTLVMVLTGFMLWNPIGTAKLLPGAWIPSAKAAHGAEAVLAVLSIITWHVYNVHIKGLNKSMFTGKLTREQMEEEHGEELDAIDAGRTWPVPPPQVIQKRRRAFMPYAVVMTIILVAGLVYFVSFEDTAIHTVPRLSAAGDLVTVNTDIADAERGAALWSETGCDVCHGESGEGTEGLASFSIAGTSLSFEAFVTSLRRGPAEMPAYNEQQLSDEDLADLWVWLTSIDAAQ
jgi:cytochrome b subunit of formate dehydrogenase/mono/diheme cytochrome c family protein